MRELIGTAQQLNIEVRTEKLLREVGYSRAVDDVGSTGRGNLNRPRRADQ